MAPKTRKRRSPGEGSVWPYQTKAGERWAIGSAVLEISEPRVPCWRLGVRMSDPTFVRRFTEALRPGAYMRIVEEGDIIDPEIARDAHPHDDNQRHEFRRAHFDVLANQVDGVELFLH